VAVAVTAAMVADHFLPVRWGYTDVLYLAPLALTMPYMLRARGRLLLLAVIAGLAFGHSLFPPFDAGVGSLVRAAALTVGLVAWTIAVTGRGAARLAPRASAAPEVPPAAASIR